MLRVNVVVTGGTGYVGGVVQRTLLDYGHRVTVVARHGTVLPGVRLAEGDIRTMDLTPSFSGADAVVHLIGIIREIPDRGITFEAMHVDSTERVIRTMEATGVSRLIHMSALGTRPHARSRYHRTKWLAEHMVSDHPTIAWTVLRPSLIFGGGAPFFQTIKALVRMPVVPMPGDGTNMLQPVYRQDVAEMIARCLERLDTVHRVYEMGGPERLTLNRLYDRVAELGGRRGPIPKLHIPVSLMMVPARIFQNLPSFPVTVDQLTMLNEPNATDDTSWQSIVGAASPMQSDL